MYVLSLVGMATGAPSHSRKRLSRLFTFCTNGILKCISDRVADRLSKLRDDHLLCLVNRIERTGENEEHDKGDDDNYYCCNVTLFHCRPSHGLVESGRIGSSCRRDSSTMIFCPVCGR